MNREKSVTRQEKAYPIYDESYRVQVAGRNGGSPLRRFSSVNVGPQLFSFYLTYVIGLLFFSIWIFAWALNVIRAHNPHLGTFARVSEAAVPKYFAFHYQLIAMDRPLVAYYLACGFLAVVGAKFINPTWAGKVLEKLGVHINAILSAGFISMVLVSFFLYHSYALCMDEFAPQFQAMIFASGKIWGTWSDVLLKSMPFQGSFYTVGPNSGHVVSAYWPGYALLKTPFEYLGLPEILNPMLAVIFTFAMIRLARLPFLKFNNPIGDFVNDRTSTGWILILTFGTASFFVNGISFYAYTAVMASNALVFYLVGRGSQKNLFLGGCIGGFALGLVNPVPHVLFALPLVGWSIFRDQRKSLYLIAGYLLTGVPFAFGWPVLRDLISHETPVSARSMITTLFDGLWLRDFSRAGLGGKKPFEVNFAWLLKFELWAFPGFTCLSFAGLWRTRSLPISRVCASQIFFVFLFYFLFVPFYQGYGWGARYFLTILQSMIFGLLALVESTKKDSPRIGSFVFFSCILSLFVLLPVRLSQVEKNVGSVLAADPCQSMNIGEVCVIDGAPGYNFDYVRNSPEFPFSKIRLLSRKAVLDSAALREILVNPVLRLQTENGSIWTSAGVNPETEKIIPQSSNPAQDRQ